MLAMVCDLPVPGGPIITKLRPWAAATTAASCEESAESGVNSCSGDRRWSSSRGATNSPVPANGSRGVSSR